MAAFSELWPLGGVGPWEGSVFMMLPTGGANLVILEGASLRQLDYDRNKFNLTEVTNENQLKVGKGLHEQVAARLKPALGALKKDAHLLIVRKSRGTEDNVTVGKGGAVKLQVGLCPPRSYKLAFKFMQHDTSTRPSKMEARECAGLARQAQRALRRAGQHHVRDGREARLFHGPDRAGAADHQQGL
jgi:hypothetical protein